MNLFRGRVPIVAALVVLVAAGLFVYADDNDGAPPASRPGPTADPNDTRTTDEIREEMLEAVAEHPYYAGAYIDGDLGIVIRATDDFDWFEAAITDYAARNRRVSIEPARYTMKELEATMAEIDMVEWREERGVMIWTVGVGVQSNRVEIGVEDLTPALEAALRAAYGDVVVIAEQGPLQEMTGGS